MQLCAKLSVRLVMGVMSPSLLGGGMQWARKAGPNALQATSREHG